MNRWKFLPLFLLIWASSCTGNRVYEEFHSFENQLWKETDSVSFDFSAVEAKGGQKLIAVRFSENYPFANCYVRVISEDSLGNRLDNRLINIPLFDSKTGQPLGKGFGNTFTKYDTLPITLSEKTRSVSLIQYMRQEELIGIEAIGFKIIN